MLIGITSIVAGTVLGYSFSKFFLMAVREIVLLPALPLYLSWKPFALTVGAFLSLFIIISLVAPIFIRTREVADLISGEAGGKGEHEYSKSRGYFGLICLGVSYAMAASTSNRLILSLVFLVPPLATIGTFYFFTDSLPLLLHKIKGRKRFYWKHFRLLSISEAIVSLRENGRMFFIVAIVSTLAFMSVGTLASLSSFASQYREMNPLALVYKSEADNRFEEEHIAQLEQELQENDIEYFMTKMPILYQTSVYTNRVVSILSISDVNQIGSRLGHESIHLNEGSALFLPPSSSSYKSLNSRIVRTALEESNLYIEIAGAYPYQILPSYAVGANAIVLNDVDFNKVSNIPTAGELQPSVYYAFDIPEWQRTKDIGSSIDDTITDSFMLGTTDSLSYTFDNPGMNYSIIRTTFSLLLLIGLLLAAVFLLASGSFIYFRLYTTLDRDRKQFEVLRRMGLTDSEFKKIVNRQLIPQFFFPWGIALLHSAFAFLSLQVIWDALAEISIVKELTIVLVGFTIMQITYFYLIRWRYLAHIKAPS